MENHYETRTRSLLKTIIWRVIATLVTGLAAYFFTAQLGETTKITIVSAAISIVAYYIHERIWNKISWGRITK